MSDPWVSMRTTLSMVFLFLVGNISRREASWRRDQQCSVVVSYQCYQSRVRKKWYHSRAVVPPDQWTAHDWHKTGVYLLDVENMDQTTPFVCRANWVKLHDEEDLSPTWYQHATLLNTVSGQSFFFRLLCELSLDGWRSEGGEERRKFLISIIACVDRTVVGLEGTSLSPVVHYRSRWRWDWMRGPENKSSMMTLQYTVLIYDADDDVSTEREILCCDADAPIEFRSWEFRYASRGEV